MSSEYMLYSPCNQHVEDGVNDKHEEDISEVEVIIQRDGLVEIVPLCSFTADL